MLDLSHKKLDVYRKSMILVNEIYTVTETFPKKEMYTLVSQLRRAAISICSNIAEGASRISRKEKKRFYEIARGSLVEIDAQFEIAISLSYYQKGQVREMEQLLESIFRMLSVMIGNLKKKDDPHSPTSDLRLANPITPQTKPQPPK